MRRLTMMCIIAAAATIGSCSKTHDAGTAPSDGVTGTYALSAVGGTTVPVYGRAMSIVSGLIRLDDGGTFEDELRPSWAGQDHDYIATGTFRSITGDSIELRYSDSRPAIIDTIVLASGVMTRRHCIDPPVCFQTAEFDTVAWVYTRNR